MAYRSPPRIEWAPDDRRLLIRRSGVLSVHALDGARLYEIGDGGFLDAAWLDDGRVIAIDGHGRPAYFTASGAPDRVEAPDPQLWDYDAAAVSADGSHVVVAGTARGFEIFVAATGGDGARLWTWSPYEHNVQPEPELYALAIAPDGMTIALGYETRAWEDIYSRRAAGRGLLVLDLSKPRDPKRDRRRDAVVDRTWYEVVRDTGPMQLAFSRARGRRRLAIAAPEREPGLGAIRIGVSDRYPRTHLGGARAVAFDDRGARAAYAYPAGIAEHRLRVDYLSTQAKGPTIIELLDTLWIEPGIGDLEALAFERAGHRIACLATDGTVEVVPVP